MKSKYADLLDTLKKRDTNHSILLVDTHNLFIRSFSVVSNINTAGNHIGGLTGFLKSLGAIIRNLSPTHVVCCVEGSGSTLHRKRINPEYKGNRNIRRITGYEIFDSKQDETESMTTQLDRVIDYLEELPVKIACIDRVEADDVIAYIAKKLSDKEINTIIVSTDEDYMQLVNPFITIYNPIKKSFVGKEEVVKKYGILPENFIYYKAINGDKSDNLDGIRGVGLKTILKFFPILGEEILPNGLDYIYDVCEQYVELEKKPPKAILSILEGWHKVESNYELMNLHKVSLSDSDIADIHAIMKEDITMNVSDFTHLYESDNLGHMVSGHIGQWLLRFMYLLRHKGIEI